MKELLPAITVNGTRISAERIAAEAQNHPAPKEKPGLAWKAAARALATRELMLQEARARGITAAPTEIAPGQIETEDEALVRQLLEVAITPEPASDDTLREHYLAHPDRFRAPSLYEAAHILIAAPEGSRDPAREKARALCAELALAPQRFGELARGHSACSSKGNGGLLGQLTSGDTVPEFEAALERLEPGTVSAEPVETRYGFHIIRLDARAEGQVLPFEAVLPRLRHAAEKAAWLRAARDFTADLAARASVTGVNLSAA
ncbi:MAG: peptidylprolyl isomerase [Pararhodobacter sp.]|nr:peptidylprolyl isomerase [Pararhodobacter sp.]